MKFLLHKLTKKITIIANKRNIINQKEKLSFEWYLQ